MNDDQVTIQDCIDMYVYFGKRAVIENGQVVGFEKRETKKNASQGRPSE